MYAPMQPEEESYTRTRPIIIAIYWTIAELDIGVYSKLH